MALQLSNLFSSPRPAREVVFGTKPRQVTGGEGFFAWWVGELAQLLPAGGPALPRDGFVVALYDGATIQLAASSRSGVEELGVVDCRADECSHDRDVALLAEKVRHNGLRLVLRLAPKLGLEVRDRLPRAAKKELRQIVANRLDRLTPWTADEVLFNTIAVMPLADDMLDVLLAVAHRRTVQRGTRMLEQLGLVPDVIDLGDGDRMAPPTHDLRRAGHRRHLPLFVPITTVLFVFAALAAGSFALLEARTREAALDQRRDYATMLERQLEDLPSLRTRIADLESEGRAVLERHLAGPSALLTIETLSRLLPDSVWLESLTLAGGQLQLSGYSGETAQLLSLLEGHPSFRAVALTDSTERLAMPRGPNEIVEVDRFSLQADVKPDAGSNP